MKHREKVTLTERCSAQAHAEQAPRVLAPQPEEGSGNIPPFCFGGKAHADRGALLGVEHGGNAVSTSCTVQVRQCVLARIPVGLS